MVLFLWAAACATSTPEPPQQALEDPPTTTQNLPNGNGTPTGGTPTNETGDTGDSATPQDTGDTADTAVPTSPGAAFTPEWFFAYAIGAVDATTGSGVSSDGYDPYTGAPVT